MKKKIERKSTINVSANSEKRSTIGNTEENQEGKNKVEKMKKNIDIKER